MFQKYCTTHSADIILESGIHKVTYELKYTDLLPSVTITPFKLRTQEK